MPAAAAIAQIAPVSPAPPAGSTGSDRPDRGFRALLESRLNPASPAADATAPAADPASRPAEADAAPEVDGPDLPRRAAAAEEAAPPPARPAGRGLALGRTMAGRLGDGIGDGSLALDPEALADLRARLAAGEDIGAEGLAALLNAAAAERSAVGPASLMAGGTAGTAPSAIEGLPAPRGGVLPGATGTDALSAGAAAPTALPEDMAQALGRSGGGAGEAAAADGAALPDDAELAARTTADDAARAAERAAGTARGLAEGDLPDGAEAALARLAEAGRGGASARAAEVADPNGAALGHRLAGGAEGFGQGGFGQGGFGQGGFGQGGFGQGGFGQGGFGQGGFADGGSAPGAVPGATGAERAAPGSFAGLVQVARGGATAGAVIEQISVAISRAGGAGGTDRVTVQLKPASLGSIEVQLEVADDGRVQAHVVADKAETLDLLRNDARSLAKALADAGLQTDAGSLNFSLKGEQQNAAGGGGSGGSGGGPGVEGAGDAAEAAPVLGETWTVADDRLDIRV